MKIYDRNEKKLPSLKLESDREDIPWPKSCSAYSSCEQCLNASSLCHFCESDHKCHTIGSPGGCVVGMSSCQPTPPNSCASHKTCDACLGASRFCHFCASDFQCHAIGSPHGCAFGMTTCHNLTSCERLEPEYIGYGPTPAAFLGVFCLVLTLSCFCCAGNLICGILRKSRSIASSSQRCLPMKKKGQSAEQVALLESDNEDKGVESDDENGAVVYEEYRDARDHFAYEESPFDFERKEIERAQQQKRLYCSFIKKILCFCFFIGFTIWALMYYPRIPEYNICNRKFDWDSIFTSVAHISPKIDYDILLSVSNPNRFGFVLEQSQATIYHNNLTVGFWHLNASTPWTAQSGAISDMLLTIHIDPGYTEGLSLLKDFMENKLVFHLDVAVAGSIQWGSWQLYRLKTQVKNIEFLVGEELDRSICKCKDYYD